LIAPRYSPAFRIGSDLLFVLFACFAATLLSLVVQREMLKQNLRESSLDRAAQNIARHLQIEPTGEARLLPPPGTSLPSADYSAMVFDRTGRLLFERPEGLNPTLVDALSKERFSTTDQGHRLAAVQFFTLALGEKHLVGGVLRIGAGDEERVIEVFKDQNAPDALIDDAVRSFPTQSIRVLLPLFALLMMTGTWIVWRRMRPMARVLEIAGTIGPHTLSLRLPERKLPADVLPIVQSVNGALERLEQAADVQREFLRRAAHHLRTPLMVLSARADTLDDSETAAELRGDVRELSRIISQLLQLNEIDALPDSEAVADLGAVGEAVRDELAPRAAMQDKNIQLTPPDTPVLVRGDPNVIEIAVRNLVENAIQHAPPRSTIGLSIGTDAHLDVVDAGPGVPDGLRDRIFEPFWSGDPHGVSAGLGLTIVSHVAARYGASISVTAGPGGGAQFTICFEPAAVRLSDLDAAKASASVPANLSRRRRREALDRAAD
jgi:two-component system sensor histidine kinase TctE